MHVAQVETDPESLRRGGSTRIAKCSCGWEGPQRATLDLATDDALLHERGQVDHDPDEARAREVMGARLPEYYRQRFFTFVDLLRYKDSRRAPGWSNVERLTCAVVLPENVREKWHVRIDDPELIAKARYFIKTAFPNGERGCSDDPRAVLVLCPLM